MSQENVEVVRAGYETWNAGNMDAVREHYDPDAILRAPEGWPEPGPFVGREAVIRQLTQLRETPGDKGPQGEPGPQGPQGDIGDAQSDLDDLDSRVSSLESVDTESQLADLDSRASDLETFQSGLCDEMFLSSASILSDLHLAAC